MNNNKTSKYHINNKIIDTDDIPIAGTAILYNNNTYMVDDFYKELFDDGSVIYHYICNKKKE